jgi:hypothetical protein
MTAGAVAKHFWEHGYAVIPRFASLQQVRALRDRTEAIIRQFDMSRLPANSRQLSELCQNGALNTWSG